MSYENWISYRYLIASKGRFLKFLNIVSIVGVAIGVMALIVVLAVMTGFGNNLREKIIGTSPHLMVEKETGIKDFTSVKEKLSALSDIKGVSGYIQGSIFLESSGQATAIIARGIEPQHEKDVTKVDQYLVKGKLSDLSGENIFIGSELARYFGYDIGDEVTLISPGAGMSGKGWRYHFKIAGIFKTGMVDFDTSLVVINLTKAQEVFGLEPSKVTGIGIRIDNPYQANEIKQKIYGILGYGFIVKSWIDINRNLFDALFLEKWGLFIILTLMILVASFNIISTLVVTVSSKIHDIGILQAVGVTKKSIRKIFTKQGIFIGGLGTFWGLVSGLSICYVLKNYVRVPQEIYSIEHVPVDIQATDMIAIVFAAMLITYLASIYPASRAAQLQPVEALRYE